MPADSLYASTMTIPPASLAIPPHGAWGQDTGWPPYQGLGVYPPAFSGMAMPGTPMPVDARAFSAPDPGSARRVLVSNIPRTMDATPLALLLENAFGKVQEGYIIKDPQTQAHAGCVLSPCWHISESAAAAQERHAAHPPHLPCGALSAVCALRGQDLAMLHIVLC